MNVGVKLHTQQQTLNLIKNQLIIALHSMKIPHVKLLKETHFSNTLNNL